MNETERKKRIEALLLSEPAVAQVTPTLIEAMLNGFALPPKKSLDWFAEELRPLIFVLAKERERIGHAELRDRLFSLAGRLRDLFVETCRLSQGSREILDYATELHWDVAELRSKRLLHGFYSQEALIALAEFYEELAERLDAQKQPPKWRAKDKRTWRVRIALYLMPIFEAGFGKKASLDKWRAASGDSSRGPWPDFYQRFMAVTLGELATPDLDGVLTEARKELGASGHSPGDFICE